MRSSYFLYNQWPNIHNYYVDEINGSDQNFGKSASKAFKTLQGCFDFISTLTGLGTNAVTVNIIGNTNLSSPAKYTGSSGIFLRGFDGNAQINSATTGCIVCSNATPASLTTYLSSGIYSNLVNNGEGMHYFGVDGNIIISSPSGTDTISLLGVKGDQGANATAFCKYVEFKPGHYISNASGAGSAIRLRNCGACAIGTSCSPKVDCDGCASIEVIGSSIGDLNFDYSSTDPDGYHYYTFYSFIISNSRVWDNLVVNVTAGYGDITISKSYIPDGIVINSNRNLIFRDLSNGDQGSSELTISGTSVLDWSEVKGRAAVTLGSGITGIIRNSYIDDNLIASAGSGAITILDSIVTGTITDSSSRLTFNKGKTVTSSAGAIAVDCSLGTGIFHTLTESTTVSAPTKMIPGTELKFVFYQSTGNSYTIAWNAIFKLNEVISATSEKYSTVSFIYNGTNWVEYSSKLNC